MDSYVYIITALLPLAAVMTILQRNPYHAIVIRGILGAISALVYTVLGAADVALTEALVGTLLAVTLYAIALRSSMVVKLGILKDDTVETDRLAPAGEDAHLGQQLVADLRAILKQHYLQVELLTYSNPKDLDQALIDKEIHATCANADRYPLDPIAPSEAVYRYRTTTRLRRLYEILQTELQSPATQLTYLNLSDNKEEKHP